MVSTLRAPFAFKTMMALEYDNDLTGEIGTLREGWREKSDNIEIQVVHGIRLQMIKFNFSHSLDKNPLRLLSGLLRWAGEND